MGTGKEIRNESESSELSDLFAQVKNIPLLGKWKDFGGGMKKLSRETINS